MATYTINQMTLPSGDVVQFQDKVTDFGDFAPVQSVNSKDGDVVLTASDVGALPDSTVIPAPGTGTNYPAMDGTKSLGSDAGYARVDHVHPKDTSKADVASPAFTGTPTAPTAAVGTDSTQVATTAFVNAEIADALGDFVGVKYEIVASISDLPATGEAGTIYLVPNSGTGKEIYDEYIWVASKTGSDKYEKIGSTDVDLSGYVQTSRTINGHDLTTDVTLTASQPTFSGTEATITVSGTPSGSITISSEASASGNYQPAGSVSQPTFTGSSSAVSISSEASASGNYQPAGTVSQPTFEGSQGSLSVTGTPSGSVTITSEASASGNYTPEGSISVTPNITLGTTTVKEVGTVGSAAVLTFTPPTNNDGNLTISWTPNVPTSSSDKTVGSGSVTSQTASGTFTGTKVQLGGSFSGNSLTSTGTFTPSGTVSQPTFSGTKVQLSGSCTPSGTISQPTFTGTKVQLSGSFSGSSLTATGTYTPQGSVTAPTIS